MTILLPVESGVPSFIQVIVGVGRPVTLHEKRRVLPRGINCLCSVLVNRMPSVIKVGQ